MYKKFIGSSIFALVFVVSVLLPRDVAQAAPFVELDGYAWSANTGWISMNCSNTGTCGASDYKVTLDVGNGQMTGYAWSNHIGWVRFGGLSSFPAASGNVAQNARVTGTYPNYTLQGWIRACAGTSAGNCSTMASRADGWDGWISLRGTNHSITTNASGAVANSFAWGSDVVGWVDFNPVTFNDTNPPPTLTLTADPDEVVYGGSTQIEYTVTGATSCQAMSIPGAPGWGGAINSANGTHTYTVTPPYGTTAYKVECTNGLSTVHEQVNVISRSNIIVNDLTAVPGTVAITGYYNRVDFLADVAGLPTGQSAPYTLTYAGNTLSGTVQNNAGSIVFSPQLRFTNVFYGDDAAVLRVDLPAPGSVAENLTSTAANEDVVGNTRSVSVSLAAPPPVMILSSVDLVRRNESATIDWEVTAPYPLTCTLVGPGLSTSFSTTAGVTATGSANTSPLTYAGVYTLECDSGSDTYTAERTIEMVPDYQEI